MKFLLPTLALVSSAQAVDMLGQGFCSYPMWSIPGVGTPTRCDDPAGCSKTIDSVQSPNCIDSFGVQGGDTCKVHCSEDHDGTEKVEVWKCSEEGFEEWELVSEELTDCSGGRPPRASVEDFEEASSKKNKKTEAGFCSYPMWGIPGVGTDTRCDDPSGCPKRIDSRVSPECVDSFGVMGGDTCTVHCKEDHDGSPKHEVWKCSDSEMEQWELSGDEIGCGGRVIEKKYLR